MPSSQSERCGGNTSSRAEPGAVGRRPRRNRRLIMRLDWMMWFATVSPRFVLPWRRTRAEVLCNDRDTLRLLGHNPFPDSPPQFVRMPLRLSVHHLGRAPARPRLVYTAR